MQSKVTGQNIWGEMFRLLIQGFKIFDESFYMNAIVFTSNFVAESAVYFAYILWNFEKNSS